MSDDTEMAARKAQWERDPSPLPWSCQPHDADMGDDDGERIEIVAADGEIVADNKRYYPQDIKPADARLIVLRVNAHDALVAALEHVRNNVQTVRGTEMDPVLGPTYLIHGITLNKVDAALALARGGK